jgi:hypothetical protein
MKIAVPYQKSYAVPKSCCICVKENASIPFKVQSNDIRTTVSKTHVSMTFMKCQSCVDELKAFNRSARSKATPATLIGSAIGLLVGLGIGFAMFQASGSDTSGDIVNNLIGPLLACGAVPALLLAGVGALIARGSWQRKLDPASQKKLVDLTNPVRLALSADQGFFGGIKSGILRLNFANDAYGVLFSQLNTGVLESIYCSKCGKEVLELPASLGLRSWAGSVCGESNKLFCRECLPIKLKSMPCPDCGKPTKLAGQAELVKAGIISINKTA